jgi:hypothetical protein
VDSQVEAIVRGLIRGERSRRVLPTARAAADIAEKIPFGHGHRPVTIDRELATQYESRAKEWLAIATRALASAGFAWTDERANDVRHLLDTELVLDWEELVQVARQRAGPKGEARIIELEAAKDRVAGEIANELHLRVIAQDRSRIPVEELLRAPRYAAVSAALSKSKSNFAASPPDLDNAVKEAIGSVEQLARVVTGKPSATLGDSIKELRSSGQVAAPLLKGIEEIWGWSSATPGVRHGGSSGAADSTTAQYVASLAHAALALLLHADAT